MSRKKKKYYVVWVGHTPGIYDSWARCKQETAGYPGSKYKSFATLLEAQNALNEGPKWSSGPAKEKIVYPVDYKYIEAVDNYALAVDAACSGNPGVMEYRGVWVEHKDVLFHQGPFDMATNNIGEFLALVHALAYFDKTGETDVTIYTDSMTAMAWVRNRKVKTTLKSTSRNRKLFELVNRAEKWLHSHSYSNPILKWNTKEWGEIPADFGRK